MTLLATRPLVVVTGISAAGKSTVADLLARRFDRGVHVRGDAFRRMVVQGRVDMAPDPPDEAVAQLRLRYRLAALVADEYHDAGFAVVLQDVILGPVLDDVVASIRARPLVVVVLAPSPDVVAAREAGRAKTAYAEGSHAIDDLDRGLRQDTPRIGLWLDTSAQTPGETVAEIVARGLAEGVVAGSDEPR